MNPKIVILAGGLGTRLRGTIGDLPKPLAPISGTPFLEYLIKLIANQGFTNVIISCGHGADAIKDFFGDGSNFGLKINFTFEKELLGTGGAIKLAEPLIDSDDFFVMNGDTYFEVDLGEMVQFHKSRNALGTIALLNKVDTGRYGRVVIDLDKRILSFSEKANGKAGLINGGIYIFRRDIFDWIPSGKVVSLENEILPQLVGEGFFGFSVNGYFIDIGIPEDYEKAKKELSLRRAL